MNKRKEAISVAIFDDTDKVLLVKRENKPHDPFGGMWSVPTVILGEGESHEDAAKRIAKQKLGVEIDVLESIGFDDGKHYEGSPLRLTEYKAKISSGTPSVPQSDSSVIQFDEMMFCENGELLHEAARKDSKCTQVLLRYLGEDWSE